MLEKTCPKQLLVFLTLEKGTLSREEEKTNREGEARGPTVGVSVGSSTPETIRERLST